MGQANSPGFFGKVPGRGDFLSRHVPSPFAAEWEAWLQALTLTVRDSGMRGWQDAWLTAPLWHFALGPALVPPHGAAGVLVASADRVGRLFPFTIIGPGQPSARLDGASWAQEAEVLTMSALEDNFDPPAFEAALARLGPPPPVRGRTASAGAYALALDGDWPASGDPLTEDETLSAGPGPGQSEWWTRGSDRIAPTRLRCNGLPSAGEQRAMILG